MGRCNRPAKLVWHAGQIVETTNRSMLGWMVSLLVVVEINFIYGVMVSLDICRTSLAVSTEVVVYR